MRSLRIIAEGPMGEGKTSALSICRQALENAGYEVRIDRSVGNYRNIPKGEEPVRVILEERIP
jgi:thymidylate kinase